MINTIASAGGLTALIAFFVVGAAGSLILRRDDQQAHAWASYFAIGGSLWGIAFGLSFFLGAPVLAVNFGASAFPLLSISFLVDTLSAFFIFTISLIALFCSIYGIGYMRHFYEKYSVGGFGFFYNTFILGMILVVAASNALLFLIVWEIMSVASYFLVVFDRAEPENVKAGFLYLVMTHVGTAFIIAAFLLMYRYTGSFDFSAMKAAAGIIPEWIRTLIFFAALIGFGTKAGLIPFHVWLPGAHPAAPSQVSGLMSGVMIKTGIFMMIRLFMDILAPVPAWWGLTILCVGSASSILGVLYALTEHDIKRLLAYHSIENIGIILLGIGSAMTFYSLQLPALALLSLSAALFHTLNHATFKSLLFLSAGAVINETHTRNMEEYGGLIKLMPYTAAFFLVGSMAISALPPFNGFFSEWLTFQALFQGISLFNFSTQLLFVLAAGSLAFTGGLALACFVKAFGISFLGRSRGTDHKAAKEAALPLRFGMAALAFLSLLFGLGSGYILSLIREVGVGLGLADTGSPAALISSGTTISVGSFAAVPVSLTALLLVAAGMATFLVVRYVVRREQEVRIGATWDCGTSLTPRMEITATGFSRSIVTVFKGILKPSLQYDIEYHDARTRYLPKSRRVTITMKDLYQTYLYTPLKTFVTALSERAKRVQSGNINAYILYIFVALLVSLLVAK